MVSASVSAVTWASREIVRSRSRVSAPTMEVTAADDRGCVRRDTVAPLGGDEFAVVLPGVGETTAITAVQRFRERLASRWPTATSC